MGKGILYISPQLIENMLSMSSIGKIEYALGGTDERGSIALVVSSDAIPETRNGEKFPTVNLCLRTCELFVANATKENK